MNRFYLHSDYQPRCWIYADSKPSIDTLWSTKKIGPMST